MKFYVSSLYHLDRDQKSISNQRRQQLSLKNHLFKFKPKPEFKRCKFYPLNRHGLKVIGRTSSTLRFRPLHKSALNDVSAANKSALKTSFIATAIKRNDKLALTAIKR